MSRTAVTALPLTRSDLDEVLCLVTQRIGRVRAKPDSAARDAELARWAGVAERLRAAVAALR